jgi:hypothetical protein
MEESGGITYLSIGPALRGYHSNCNQLFPGLVIIINICDYISTNFLGMFFLFKDSERCFHSHLQIFVISDLKLIIKYKKDGNLSTSFFLSAMKWLKLDLFLLFLSQGYQKSIKLCFIFFLLSGASLVITVLALFLLIRSGYHAT